MITYGVIALLSLLCVGLYLRNRLLRRVLSVDPFDCDLKRMTTKIKVKRPSGDETVEVSLLQILDATAGQGKSMEHCAEDLSKTLKLKNPLTENEMRLILMFVSPMLAVFTSALKKASSLG